MDLNTCIQNFIEQYGLVSIFIIVMLEYANLPLPSEIVLPFVGYVVLKGNIGFFSAIMASIVGGLLGSITNYYIGYYFGTPLIKYIVKKYPKTEKSAIKSSEWLRKYGKISVMVTRVVPLARTFISIPAGISKMNLPIFILYSAIGIGIWNFFLISLGYLVGDNLSLIIKILNQYSISVAIIGTILIGFYLYKMKKGYKMRKGYKMKKRQ